MTHPAKKWALFALRWGIAVAGIWWVVSKMYMRDYVSVVDENNRPTQAALASPATEKSQSFLIYSSAGQKEMVPRQRVVNPPDRPTKIALRGGQTASVLAFDLSEDLKSARRILIEDPQTTGGVWKTPADVEGGPKALSRCLQVPQPRVRVGIITLVRQAQPWLLWASILVMPLVYVITSVRWNALLRALDIHLTQSRTFVLNMVGCFYNTFMPGSTGGDLLKAYYASKQTPHRTHAVLSVLIDRVIGLMALVMLGGIMATIEYLRTSNPDDPAVTACRSVAMGSAAILASAMLAVAVFASTGIRRMLGLDALLKRLPLQKHVQHAIQVMRTYRSRPGLVFLSLLATFPVHITVVISAMLAGKAFGLPLPTAYYFVAVPVIVLSAAIPLSPQGAGVMEFFAIQLTKQHGMTVSQAFALAMSIRAVQMFWNLTGGFFVLRGGYHAPTEHEAEELEQDEALEPAGKAG